jgi:chromosome segregation ATPase
MAAGTKTSGGIHVGNVGGNVTFRAGGDVVGGNKTTTEVARGTFASEEQRSAFSAELEALREALRTLKSQIEASAEVDADAKDEVSAALLAQIKALKEARAAADAIGVGAAPAPAALERVEKTLESAGGVVEQLSALAEKGTSLAATLGSFAAKYGPLLLSARHLFGLP